MGLVPEYSSLSVAHTSLGSSIHLGLCVAQRPWGAVGPQVRGAEVYKCR
jgi:hypothetical protein